MQTLLFGALPDTIAKYGSGSGYGSGYGDGYGDGSGSGYGSGYGDGYGDGSGSGYGDGYGDGYGSAEYWSGLINSFSKSWPTQSQQRLQQLQSNGSIIAYWRSSPEGKPCNGGSGPAVHAGLVEKISGPLEICTRRALHATKIPSKWKGERIWIVALIGEVQWDGDKCGALEREILGECL